MPDMEEHSCASKTVKIGDGTHKRLANVPFRITSKTTGESHIIVTDKNGQFSTSSDWVSHKQNTNAGKTSEDGIWFGTSTPDDSKGALLYDTYTIEELRCDSNKGMTLIPAFDVVVLRNKVVVDLGTLTDEYEPEITIHTTATDKVTGEKSIVAGKSVTIVDTVTLDGLTKGTKYQLKGWQMVKSENAQLLIDGQPVESGYTFTAEDSSMEVEIAFTFNASSLAGKDLVTFEELYDLSNPDEPTKVAEHKDIEDEGQTVTITERIITMHTTATDKATGKKTIEAGKDVTIVDTVTLDGLEKGVKYTLKGWQMVKSENAELIVGGKRVENDLIAVWENVAGAFSSNHRLDFKFVLESFTDSEIPMPDSGRWAKCGMVRGSVADVCWRLLDAQYWGEPSLVQRRKRVFVVADFGGQRAAEILLKSRQLYPLPDTGTESGLSSARAGGISAAETGREIPVLCPFEERRMRSCAKSGDIPGFLRSFGRSDDPFPTLLAGAVNIFSFWYEGKEKDGVIRYLTPLECERLMGLPDNWTKYDYLGKQTSANARCTALGNAIALPCAEYIMAGIKEVLEG